MRRTRHEPVVDPRGPGGPGEPIVRLVDDDPSFLRALSRRLEAAGFSVQGYQSAEAFLSRLTDAPGCAVLDLRMPGLGGLELQEWLSRHDEPLPIIFLTGHGDIPSSVRAMKYGAVDFFTKPVAGEALVQAIHRAVRLDAEARADRREMREFQASYRKLTERERQVFALVVRGLLNKQIAGELGTSERTVKAHRAQVMRKMKASSIADLARIAGRLFSASGQSIRP